MQNKIRNFSIIAHIDHGKSTLADRLLEVTGSIENRQHKEQVLDTMDIERERGITIKLQPARMNWRGYELNLIDTPGHVDFAYEVSRSLAAVEGVLLVVDATQGVQAQTLANLHMAVDHNLTIVPVINKIDLPASDPDRVIEELIGMGVEFACDPVLISAKTGSNVEAVLEAIIQYIPAPSGSITAPARALIFDSYFDSYRGVITYIRMVDGHIDAREPITMTQTQKNTEALEVGSVCVGLQPLAKLETGQIGYIVTTLKDVSAARVGDTIALSSNPVEPLPGYAEPMPMVFAGIYTGSGEEYDKLRDALSKLKLNDASLSYEPATSQAFGFGFKAGFLGLLHLEIIKERLEREYDLELIITTPTVAYKQTEFSWEEPWVKLELIIPESSLGQCMQLVSGRRGMLGDVNYLGQRVVLEADIPLSEVIVDFYDKLKGATSGYGSMNYALNGYRPADLVQLDILIAHEIVEPLSRLVPRQNVERIAREIVARLKNIIPRQNFEVRIQAAVGATILASERVAPYRKDVTAKLYGGDITRRRKLLEKQKKGKKKMARLGNVEVPTEVFIKVLRTDDD